MPGQPPSDLTQWSPVPLPDRRATLNGERIDLVPLDPVLHCRSLYTRSHHEGDPNLWKYLFYGPFGSEKEFRGYLERCAGAAHELFYAVVDRESGEACGVASYLRMAPEHGSIEIGHIWFGVGLQRTPAATEAIYLLARHVFDDLGYRRLEWKCDALNHRSRRAATRFGFQFEGIFRGHMVVKGRNRDTAWYAMVESDWPVAGEAFRSWLAAENFDRNGDQGRSLEGIRKDLVRANLPMGKDEFALAAVTVRDAEAVDEGAWRKMWKAYNTFYESTVPDDVTAFTWQRIIDVGEPFGCLLAFEGDHCVGFANYVIGPYTWSRSPHCLMEDLFVEPGHRGAGTGRALITALVRRAAERRWTEVYWLTQSDNVRARRLYESLTPPDGFIQYTIEVDSPPSVEPHS